MTEFTPWISLGGGALIGLAAVLLMATNGTIAGISGITSRLLPPTDSNALPGAMFVLGLIISIPLMIALGGSAPEQVITQNTAVLLAAGLLVGIGTTIGNGCTSGHGVCGISRLSTRSIVATITFMATAGITVFVARHIFGG